MLNYRAKWRGFKPVWNVVSKHPTPDRDRARIVSGLAFAGDHKNQPLLCGVSGLNKTDQTRMRLGQSHSVKIQPPLELHLAALHPAIGAVVHPHWRRRCSFGMFCRPCRPFTNLKVTNPKSGRTFFRRLIKNVYRCLLRKHHRIGAVRHLCPKVAIFPAQRLSWSARHVRPPAPSDVPS